MTNHAEVKLWGKRIGVASMQQGRDYAAFEYDKAFAQSGIEISPLKMPLSSQIYTFPNLPPNTFHGLPGLLSDSLPDKFGNALINAWLAAQGRTADSFNAVERLCYTGSRGMGALEFSPTKGPKQKAGQKIEIDALVKLASEVLTKQDQFTSNIKGGPDKALRDILRVGTSAGGARAKAVIAWNPETNEIRSGQVKAGLGFEYWLLKFDGVSGNKDKDLEDPKGYGAIEYAYYLMALACGITMSDSRILEEHGRRHFMTRRFDRLAGGQKLHMQSLGALAHLDFNQIGVHSYEEAFLTIRQLNLPAESLEEQFRRMVFNVVARNQDDHVKNIAFVMDKQGTWSLSPAFDMTYSYNPTGPWTSAHQMTLNGKRDGFLMEDFRAASQAAIMKQGRAKAIVDEVVSVVTRWPDFATQAGVSEDWLKQIKKTHRLKFDS